MRYYFHLGDGAIARDADGEDHADDQAAADAAVQVLAELLPGQRPHLWKTRRFSVAVKDETGRLVVLLTTTTALDMERSGDAPPAM